MIDLLYVSFNRLEYTRESFSALVEHTDWDQVERLFIADDASTDGTTEWLTEAIGRSPFNIVPVDVNQGPFGGPVAAMNWYLDNASTDVEMFAKIDNDMVVCPDWLGEMLMQMHLHPELDILGMEPLVGPPVLGHAERGVEECRHIGGKGILRHRAFEHCRPRPYGMNGYQGFTQWQLMHPGIPKAWIRPELGVFGLDQIPDEHWRGLAEKYAELGWQRLWPVYAGDDHHSWWKPVHA